MIIKDYFADGLLQIAIVLSLLRSDLDSFLDTSARPLLVRSHLSETNGGPLSGITRTDFNLQSRQVVREYPKVLDRYSDRFSTVLRDLHSLSYFRRFNGISTNVDAWLVNDGGPDGSSSSCEHSTGDDAAEANTTTHNISSPSVAEDISVLTPEPNDMNRLVEDELSKEVDYMLCLYNVTMSVCVCSYAHIVARSNLCKNVVLRGCGRLRGSISYFLATRSSQINVEAANDVDPKYWLNPRSIVSLQVRVGDVWVGVVWACNVF